MTDKQIIIDGVDVAKCRCFTSEWDFNNCGHICKGTECKYKRLWYKKQLQAKEQECEKIKNWVKGMMFYTDCSNWFERFTTAFEDWKNDLISQLDQLKGENVGVLKQLEFVRTLNTVQEAEIRKLTKTLAEIKEFIQSDYCTEIASCEFCAEAGNCLNRKILQKISECELENE